MTEQPRTAAGRALLADWDEEEQGEIASRILAIEAQACPALASEERCDSIENNGFGEPTECGRALPCEYHDPAVASEGLRTAAGRGVASERHYHQSDCAVQTYLNIDAQGPCDCGFTDAILAIEAQACPAVTSEGLRAALTLLVEHRLCGPIYDGCYSHWSHMEHCRADGMKWPCDVEGIRAALASDAGSVGALDVERLARALHAPCASPRFREAHPWTAHEPDAAAIAAAYDAERQGEPVLTMGEVQRLIDEAQQ